MKTQTIQHPERYEAPGVKVMSLRKRLMLVQSLAQDEAYGNGPGEMEEGQI